MEESSGFRPIPSSPPDTYHDYRRLSVHGRSVLGTVSGHGRRWFVKSLIPSLATSTAARQSLKKEFDILLGLNHPSVVRAIEFVDLPEVGPSIIMEFLDGRHLDEAAIDMNRKERRRLAIQLVDAMAYLHSKGITHGDLKPENIIVGGNVSAPQLKIIDFNLADSVEFIVDKEAGGNKKYAAPEQFLPGYRLLPAADVYSLGLLLRELRPGLVWQLSIRKALNADQFKRHPDASAFKTHLKKSGRNGLFLCSFVAVLAVALIILFVIPGSVEDDGISESDEIPYDTMSTAPVETPDTLLTTDSLPEKAPEVITQESSEENKDKTSGSQTEQMSSEPVEKTNQVPDLPVMKANPSSSGQSDSFTQLDKLRAEKENQIRQIFSEYEKEIREVVSDPTMQNRDKRIRVNDLYATAWNLALYRFEEFLDRCPQEYISNPPSQWIRFISQTDFENFNNFVIATKKSLNS